MEMYFLHIPTLGEWGHGQGQPLSTVTLEQLGHINRFFFFTLSARELKLASFRLLAQISNH